MIRTFKFLNILKEKRSGAAAFEFVLLTPLMATAFMLCFFVFCISISYIHYNSLANYVAQSMNLRQTSYTEYAGTNTDVSAIQDNNTTALTGDNLFKLGNKSDLASVNIPIKGNSPTAKGVLNDIVVSANADGKFDNIVGSKISLIQADVTKNGAIIDTSMSSNIAGSLIHVQIYYTCFGLDFIATGFNMIV